MAKKGVVKRVPPELDAEIKRIQKVLQEIWKPDASYPDAGRVAVYKLRNHKIHLTPAKVNAILQEIFGGKAW